MEQASVALHNAGLEIARAFNPIFQIASGGILDVTGAMQHHQRATRNIARAGVGFMAALGVARFAGIPLPGILGRISGRGGQAFVAARAVEAATSGATGLGATPQNPLYVTVVGQLFGGSTPPPGSGGEGSSFWRKILTGGGSRAALARAGLAGAGSAAAIAAIALAQHGDQGGVMHITPHGGIRWSPTGRPYRFRDSGVPGNTEHDIFQLSRAREHQLILRQARRVFGGNVTGFENYGAGMWKGQADINLTIIRDENGKRVRERVHIPIDMWAHGRHPSHRGRKNIRTR
jgi:hypothetical protein